MSLRDVFIGQELAHDAELFGDDRLDFWVIRQCAAVDRDCFKGMIDQRLNVGLESGSKLFYERNLRIMVGACQEPTTGTL